MRLCAAEFTSSQRNPRYCEMVAGRSILTEAMLQFLEQIEADVQSRPSAIEFEMAYQARVAMDRIKFAIKHTEQFAPRTDASREAGLQLLDALDRLQFVDRRFQRRSRSSKGIESSNEQGIASRNNGKGASCGSANGA
jgi:hypothetical protein